MTSSILYGGYKYESGPSRALGSITRESYQKVWGDEGRVLAKLVSDVTYQAAYMRKMQKGIDDANQNFIQQIQSFISDFIILLGGAGDTGLDFGDLKYVIQAIGALFGFADEDGNITVPVNLFNVAWHFFSNFIMPVDNFREFIDQLIDAAIATVLDLFGEVPIVGQALQQFAQIVSDIRDLLDPIADAVQAFFDAFNIEIGDINGIADFFGPFAPIVQALMDALDGVDLPNFAGVFHQIALWSSPFVQSIADLINGLAEFTGGFGLFNFFGNIPIANLSNTAVQLLTNPKFISPISIEPNAIYSWDGTVGRTDPGAALTTANGQVKPLSSNLIIVAQDQKIDFELYTKWSVLTGSGTPIQLTVSEYEDGVLKNIAVIDSITGFGLNSTTYVGQVNGWVKLSGSYTVPANVDRIRVRAVVNASATGGSVWFDDASAIKSSKINQNWIEGFTDLIEGLFGPFGGTVSQFINFFVNLTQAFGLFDILDLASVDPSDFDPLEFWARIITTFMNPLGLLRDTFLGGFIQDLIDTIITVLKKVPFVGGTLADVFEHLTNLNETSLLAVTPQNPPIISQSGRIDALQAQINSGTEGFVDHFNDPTTFTTNWITVTGQQTPLVKDSAYAWGNDGRAAAYAAPGGVAFEFATNEWNLQANIAAISQRFTTQGISGISRLWVGDAAMTNYVAVRAQWSDGWDPDAHFAISTGISPSATTIRSDVYDIDKNEIHDNDVLILTKRFNSITSKYNYTLYYNSDQIATWEDASSILTSAAGNRKVGIVLNAEGFASKTGFGWDDLSASDKTP